MKSFVVRFRYILAQTHSPTQSFNSSLVSDKARNNYMYTMIAITKLDITTCIQ